ncbi:hypothetical protein ABZ517_01800 [Streptomyces scabiei]|uniref:hypothetical protein n=1 Tax=Streptomyces scabiei TaxID=1930 RepID=UPI0033E93D7B
MTVNSLLEVPSSRCSTSISGPVPASVAVGRVACWLRLRISTASTPSSVAGLTVAGQQLDVAIDSDGRVGSVSAPAGLMVEERAALWA